MSSFAINAIFLLETILTVISHPHSILKFWHISNVFLVLCSVSTLYLNVLSETQGNLHAFIDNSLTSAQIFRFFLIMKHVKFVRKFIKTFKMIIIQSFPIISLFFMVIFFYGMIGFFIFPPNNPYFL